MYIRFSILVLLSSLCFAQVPTISPASGATLSGASVTFTFDTNGNPNVEKYWLYLGTEAGNWNLHNGEIPLGGTAVVSGIPTDGSPIYGSFFRKISGAWSGDNISYTAFTAANCPSSPITTDITLNVSGTAGDFPTIQAALDCLNSSTIVGDSIVTIQVADGTYANYETIYITHPQGKQIHIIGNTSNPELCQLHFKSGANGIVIWDGNRLGLVDGLVLRGFDSNGSNAGVFAHLNSYFLAGSSLIAENWGVGLNVTGNSSASVEYVTARNNGIGFNIDHSSYLDASFSVANGNKTGYFVKGGSDCRLWGASASGNTEWDLRMRWNSVADLGNFDPTTKFIETGSIIRF